MTDLVKKIIAGAVLLVLLFFGVYFTIKYISNLKKENEDLKKIATQNELEYNSKIDTLKNKNVESYQKLAYITNINDKLKKENSDLNKFIEDQKLTITNYIQLVGKIKAQQDSGKTALQNFVIPSELVGRFLTFIGGNPFHSYRDSIVLGNPSRHYYMEQYAKFGLNIATARNDKGVMSGIVSFVPNWVKDYVNIDSIAVTMDKDEFLNKIATKISSFSILPSVGLYALPQIYLNIGFGICLIDRHILSYTHGIGVNYQSFTYSYKINF
jgi:uncharacterized protein (UPF0305 family)